MSRALAFVFALLVLKKLHARLADDEESQMLEGICSKENCHHQPGKSLIQVRQTSMRIQERGNISGPGETAGLDDQGFKTVRDLCCSAEMQAFVMRVIAREGFKVCRIGGVAGLVVWYDCANDEKSNDFRKLVADIKAGADPNADCPWLTRQAVQCPPVKSCPSFPDAEFPPCNGGDPDTYICCGFKNGYVPTHSTVQSNSIIQQWDCKAHAGPIQVLTSEATGSFYNVSELILPDAPGAVSATYKTLFQIPLSRTNPPMEKRMNSVALNPVDGLAYATIAIKEDPNDPNKMSKYIVRFDKDNFEFVARIPELGTFSKVYTKDSVFLGAFGQSGTYYFAGNSNPGNGLDLFAVPNIATYDGFANQKQGLKEATGSFVTYAKFPTYGADIAIANGNFDGLGDSEWLFVLQGGDFKLGLAKIVNSDLSSINQNTYILTTQLSAATNEEHKAFGAGWSFMDEIFFSRNGGQGVFHVLRQSIDLNAKTFLMNAVTGQTPKTNNNDGMNCLDAPPPFHGKCKSPEWEVDQLADGKCPQGSYPVAK